MNEDRAFKAFANIKQLIAFLEDDTYEVTFEPTIKEMLDIRTILKCLDAFVLSKIKGVEKNETLH